MTAENALPTTFEGAMTELETLIAGMETGQLPLAESLAAYRRGARLLQFCQSVLKEAEQEVRILEGDVLKPFEAVNPEG